MLEEQGTTDREHRHSDEYLKETHESQKAKHRARQQVHAPTLFSFHF